MFVQLEDLAVVETQSLPDRVAALHHGVEWTDAGLIAVDQVAVDVDDQIAISVVELLQHVVYRFALVESSETRIIHHLVTFQTAPIQSVKRLGNLIRFW